MISRKFFVAATAASLALCGLASAADSVSYGIVNFTNCVTDSKLGKEEQASFENLKKQFTSHLEETEKQITELSSKFNDREYMDGLSPEAEEEMKTKIRTLNEELNRYQNQYYQVLNQANMRVIQAISTGINTAAEKVSKEKKLSMVLNKDACFFYSPTLDVTNLIVAEMDKAYELDAKKQPTANAAAEAPTQPAAEATKAK